MGTRHLLVNLEDSKTKQALVKQAWLAVGGKREDLFQTEDPKEVLGMIHDLAAEILEVITDNDIEGQGTWAIKVAEAAAREKISHVLVYSGHVPPELPKGVDGLARTEKPEEDLAKLVTWLKQAA